MGLPPLQGRQSSAGVVPAAVRRCGPHLTLANLFRRVRRLGRAAEAGGVAWLRRTVAAGSGDRRLSLALLLLLQRYRLRRSHRRLPGAADGNITGGPLAGTVGTAAGIGSAATPPQLRLQPQCCGELSALHRCGGCR